MTLEPVLLVGALLTLAGVVASKLAARLGVPSLLLFLAVGMLAGVDGPGGIDFDDAGASQIVGIVALTLILFDGGLSTRGDTVRPYAGRGVSLATLGVVGTAGVTGVAASALLGVPVEVGLLLGAIVASTDSAAVFSVLRSRRSGLRDGVQPTLELESGLNDPMAVFLTIGLVEIVSGASTTWLGFLALFVAQAGIGTLAGVLAGHAGHLLLNRIRLDSDGLYPVLTLTLVFVTYAGTTLAGGSGFLAVFLCGAWLGNRDVIHGKSIGRFLDAVAWLAQITMFLVLGLLVSPSRLPAVAWSALAVTVVLVFVARPLATAVTLSPLRVPWRDQAIIAWVGLRGATPIILATYPLVDDVPEAQTLFDVVFFVVLTSVLIQGTTVGVVARLLGMDSDAPPRHDAPLEPGRPLPDGTTLRVIAIRPGTHADGRALVDLGLPPDALLVLIERDGTYLVPTGSTGLCAGDAVTVLANDTTFADTRRLLERAQDAE